MPTDEPPAIDDLDRALVARLRRDGRESNRSLATALGVNEITVASRLRRLAEASIMRVVALTDIDAFGYRFLVFVALRVRSADVAEAAQRLARLPQAISVTVATGRFDIIATVLAHDLGHLSEVLEVKVPAIAGVEVSRCELAIEIVRFDSMLALLRAPELPVEPPAVVDGVDQLDLSIIALLQRDARISNRRIAQELGVSEGTIRARIRRMERARLIRIQAVSDVIAFGIRAHAYVGIQVDAGAGGEVARALMDVEEIAVLARTIGEFDLFAVVAAEDREHLIEVILGRIARTGGVRHTETFESWRTIKHAYTWARLV